jgi:hypothetical protein
MWPFGKRSNTTYPDAGTQLLAKLIQQFSLPGWRADLVPTFSSDEAAAIDEGLTRFQRLADSEAGEGAQGSTYFHPDAAKEIQRMFSGEELIRYADAIWQFSDELPSDWRIAASSYLKAWTVTLSPIALQKLGELLAAAGQVEPARATFSVILEVPHYAPKLWGDGHHEVATRTVALALESIKELG